LFDVFHFSLSLLGCRSTYLLAFVVGEFDFLGGVASNGVEVRVFVSPRGPVQRADLPCRITGTRRLGSPRKGGTRLM
jgi:hypothetical protein